MDNYKQQVIEDLKWWVEQGNAEGLTLYELRDRLMDASWTDSITGNSSGSYYCNSYKAQEQIYESGILWDEEFIDTLSDYGIDIGEILKRGAETVDVWARCIALERLTYDELKEITNVKEDK